MCRGGNQEGTVLLQADLQDQLKLRQKEACQAVPAAGDADVRESVLSCIFQQHMTSCQGLLALQDGADSRRRLELFKPAFSQLVTLICGRVRYPEDWDTWHRDNRDEFKQQRYSVADTLLDAAGKHCIYTSSTVLAHLESPSAMN